HLWSLLPLFQDALRQSLVAVKREDRSCPCQNAPMEHSARQVVTPVETPVRLSQPGASVCPRSRHAYRHWPQTGAPADLEERTAGLFLASESPRRTVWRSAGAGLS